ncbi:PfkB family carbohydrate kinase [Mesorhizobium sp. M0833]|uniref:PfkB family carbohydrate kinase n=1 Tax=Mesorhizobium sp. M0833 TaxID=2957009 RepID=UPI003339E2C3
MNTQALTSYVPRNQVVGTGLVALDRIHVGEQEPLFEELGGSCGNVLISLAMLGWGVTPLLRLGNDPVGSRLESDLRTAGADTRLVSRHQGLRSPVIAELLDPASGDHTFSFTCPESSERFGSFQPITIHDLEPARAAVASCTIFYADRISETICDAMETAAAGGAIIHFEPSGIGEPDQFDRAVSIAHIFKYSADRLSPEIAGRLRPEAFTIVTAGRYGLEVRHAGEAHRCEACDAHMVRDTCGSGDMVTLGLLDTIIQNGVCHPASLSISTVLAGIRSGQRLAAANCAYIGARGIFRECGPSRAREILADG